MENQLEDELEKVAASDEDVMLSLLGDFDQKVSESTYEGEKDSFSDVTEETPTGEPVSDKPEKKKAYLEFVNPKMAIGFFDVIMCRAMSGLSNVTGLLPETDYKDFKLDADEKKALEEPLAEYLATLKWKPESKLMGLLIAIMVIYSGKVIQIMANEDKPKPPKPAPTEKTTEKEPKGQSGGKSWEGDKRYFQTGDKAGTLKPNHR